MKYDEEYYPDEDLDIPLEEKHHAFGPAPQKPKPVDSPRPSIITAPTSPAWTQDEPTEAGAYWTQDEPTEAGAYWMWDGSDDSLPAHVEVFWSGTDNRCFVRRGQYGWTRYQDMDELKGYWWHKLVCPPLPRRENNPISILKQ